MIDHFNQLEKGADDADIYKEPAEYNSADISQ
jgi:hypothetical protein